MRAVVLWVLVTEEKQTGLCVFCLWGRKHFKRGEGEGCGNPCKTQYRVGIWIPLPFSITERDAGETNRTDGGKG